MHENTFKMLNVYTVIIARITKREVRRPVISNDSKFWYSIKNRRQNSFSGIKGSKGIIVRDCLFIRRIGFSFIFFFSDTDGYREWKLKLTEHVFRTTFIRSFLLEYRSIKISLFNYRTNKRFNIQFEKNHSYKSSYKSYV